MTDTGEVITSLSFVRFLSHAKTKFNRSLRPSDCLMLLTLDVQVYVCVCGLADPKLHAIPKLSRTSKTAIQPTNATQLKAYYEIKVQSDTFSMPFVNIKPLKLIVIYPIQYKKRTQNTTNGLYTG